VSEERRTALRKDLARALLLRRTLGHWLDEAQTMNDRALLLLLRRIALGLPLVAAPVVLIGGCSQHCTPGATVSTRHAATDPVRARLGMGDTFDPSVCRELCLELDGVTASTGDAGLADGGAMPMVGAGFAQTASVTCGWADDTTISCDYQGATTCSGGSSCIIPPCAVAGRAPPGLIDARPRRARGEVGAWLADAARLEAASVVAFEDLAIELALHDAPALSRWASASAADESRHAHDVARLARRVGAEPAGVMRGDHTPRSLFEIARDNAVEGCVREAFGALVAVIQSQQAESASVRSSFTRIARDEAGHALFSLALDAWARDRVSPRECRALEDARYEARAQLEAALAVEAPPSSRAVLGLPDATRAVDALALVT
jgi:hypothetical protein